MNKVDHSSLSESKFACEEAKETQKTFLTPRANYKLSQQKKKRQHGNDPVKHRQDLIGTQNVIGCKSNPRWELQGPRGLDKILISPDGDITVTNDGATILSQVSEMSNIRNGDDWRSMF